MRLQDQVALLRKEADENHMLAESARYEGAEVRRSAEESCRRLEEKAAEQSEQLDTGMHAKRAL